MLLLKDDRISLVNENYNTRPARNHFANPSLKFEQVPSFKVDSKEEVENNNDKRHNMTFRQDEEVAQLNEKVERLKEENRKINEEKEELRVTCTELHRKVNYLEGEYERFEGKINGSLVLVSDLQKKNELLRIENESYKLEIEELHRRTDKTTSAKEKTLEILRKDFENTKKELKTMSSRLESGESISEVFGSYTKEIRKQARVVNL